MSAPTMQNKKLNLNRLNEIATEEIPLPEVIYREMGIASM